MYLIVSTVIGLFFDCSVAILAAIFPLILGIVLSLVVKKKPAFGKVASWFNIPFEAICIPIMLCICFYLPGYIFGFGIFRIFRIYIAGNIVEFGTMFLISFVIGLAYLLYMPTRYNNGWSLIKNILYNGIGMFSAMLKWSIVCNYLLHTGGMLRNMMNYGSMLYNYIYIVIPFLVYGFIFVLFELIKVLIKQFMK